MSSRWTTLKIAVLAPMPSASVITASAVTPALCRACRQASATSCTQSWNQPMARSQHAPHARRELVGTEQARHDVSSTPDTAVT